MDIGNAVKMLKQGYSVCRSGWNGKGMWLTLIKPYAPHPTDTNGNPVKTSREHCNPYFRAADNNPRAFGTMLDWVGLKTADNKFIPWNASQQDLLAEDWEIAVPK